MTHSFSGKIQLFPGKGGWYYVVAPPEIVSDYKPMMQRSLAPITARVGKSSWKTSLMPLGKNLGHDGGWFVPLPAKIRESEKLKLGDTTTIQCEPREY